MYKSCHWGGTFSKSKFLHLLGTKSTFWEGPTAVAAFVQFFIMKYLQLNGIEFIMICTLSQFFVKYQVLWAIGLLDWLACCIRTESKPQYLQGSEKAAFEGKRLSLFVFSPGFVFTFRTWPECRQCRRLPQWKTHTVHNLKHFTFAALIWNPWVESFHWTMWMRIDYDRRHLDNSSRVVPDISPLPLPTLPSWIERERTTGQQNLIYFI